jgi:PII-like signaling protein
VTAAGLGWPASAVAVKLTAYFGERSRTGGRFSADALLDAYGRDRVAVSALLRAAEGFGPGRHPRTDRSPGLSADLPLIAVAVDTRERILPLAEETARLCGTGLVTLEAARLVNGARGSGDGDGTADRAADSGLDGWAEEVKLTVYLGRGERAGRVPGYVAVCHLLRRRGVAGATTLVGVDGTRHGHRERAGFFRGNAGTPAMVVAVGDGARVAAALPELSALLPRPLLTLERVRICKRDGEVLAPPAPPCPAPRAAAGVAAWPSREPGGPGAGAGVRRWQKLTVYTSESALHDGQPVQRALVRRLRAAGLSGATTQRGVWGFHGDHAPHGDRLLQLGRRVPAVTVVIDEPDRIAEAFAVADELTTGPGLVTCETVPALRAWDAPSALTGH